MYLLQDAPRPSTYCFVCLHGVNMTYEWTAPPGGEVVNQTLYPG